MKRFFAASFVSLCISANCFCQSSDHERHPPKTRVSFFPNVSFYKNDTYNTANTVPQKSFGISAKEEFHVDKITKILVGLSYLQQGLTFESYYKAPGFPLTANTGYNFVHEIRYHEMRLPVQVKLHFSASEEKAGTGYLFFGWEARFIFKARESVSDKFTGALLWESKNEKLEIEHKFIFKQAGNMLNFGTGYEYKIFKRKHAVFMEVCYHYALSRFHYTGNNKSNDIFIKNPNLEFGVGYTF